MDFELRAAREKLEREQRERKERAKAKLERERKAKAEAARQREAIEASQRIRRLDAAHALIEAEQQMEENRLIGKGIMFFRTLEALPFGGYGDKIKLPPSCFTELADQGALDKGPMYFRLSRIDEGVAPSSDVSIEQETRTTHSGVLEFTAREGSVELPPHVWSNLFSHDTLDVSIIEVRYVGLPKGTYAKLQSEGMGFSDIPNHKAVLETTLRKHATLSHGDIITVNYGELSYKLRVLELKPASSVSVLETDIEVDIEGPESVFDANKDQHVLIPLVLGKVESGIVDEGKFNYYKFSIEDSIGEKVSSGSMSIEVNIEADSGDGDTNIYVSRHPLIFPTQHLHEWSSHEMGSKVLILRQKDSDPVVGNYSIGVFGFKGLAKYQITISLKAKSRQRTGEVVGASSQVDVDAVECRNCRHYISRRTIFVHEAYCVRHNIVCQHDGCGVVLRKEEAGKHVHCGKCGQAFQKEEMEKHNKVFHEPLRCPCGVILEKKEMFLTVKHDDWKFLVEDLAGEFEEQKVEHQSSSCTFRLITCRFCGDMVHAGSTPVDPRDRMRGLSEHESICGSRTAPCDSCGRSVMLKEMDIHIIAVHQKS